MKEAIGGLGLFQIVIVFLALFSGYLCLSVNSSKAYKVKDQIINIIQKHNGVDDNAVEEIQSYLTTVGYRATGQCNADEIGYGANGTASYSRDALFCVKEIPVHVADSDNIQSLQLPDISYYSIRVFFKLDLPVFREVFAYDIGGDTRMMYYPVG